MNNRERIEFLELKLKVQQMENLHMVMAADLSDEYMQKMIDKEMSIFDMIVKLREEEYDSE